MSYEKKHTFSAHAAAVYGLSNAKEDHLFYSASGDGYVALWNAETLLQEKFAVNVSNPVYCVRYCHILGWLAIGTSTGAIHIIDAIEKKEIHHLQLHVKGIYDIQFDDDKNLMYVAGGDGVLSVWSLPSFQLLRSIPLCEEKVRQIALRADGIIAVACGDGNIRILEPSFFNEIATIRAHEGGATAVCWHPNKPVLISGGKDAHLKCWKSDLDYKSLISIPAHYFAIYSFAFLEKNKILATASRDKTIKIWDANSLEHLQTIDSSKSTHTHSVNRIIACGRQLVSCGDDRQIIIWEKNEPSL